MSMNDGGAQQSPENKSYADERLHELHSILNNLDINSFAEDLVEQGATSKFAQVNESKQIPIGAVHTESGRGVSLNELAKVF